MRSLTTRVTDSSVLAVLLTLVAFTVAVLGYNAVDADASEVSASSGVSANYAVGEPAAPALVPAAKVAKPSILLQTVDGKAVKTLRSTDAISKFKNENKTKLRKNFGPLIVIAVPAVWAAYRIWRVACPWVTAGSVAWASWKFKQGTGRWPTPWEAASWGRGTCRVI